VPDPHRRVGHFVTHKPNAVISRVRLDLVYRCPTERFPSLDGRVRSLRRGSWTKRETGRAADSKLTVRGIVVHVTFAWVLLTPDVLVWRDVLRLGKIGRSRIKCGVQIVDLNPNPVRYAVVAVTAVVVRSRRKFPGKGIYPGARTDAVLLRI
jgi:hypothetical protein